MHSHLTLNCRPCILCFTKEKDGCDSNQQEAYKRDTDGVGMFQLGVASIIISATV